MTHYYLNEKLNSTKLLFSEEENDVEDEENIVMKSLADNLPSEFSCDGSLTLVHTMAFNSKPKSGTENNYPIEELRSMKTVRLSSQKYPDLGRRILTDDRKLIHIESTGNCCWQFSSSQYFRGLAEFANIGYKGLPHREVKSIKQISCDLVKEY